MKKPLLKKILKWVEITSIIYFSVGALLYFFQDKLIFRPKKLKADFKFEFPVPFRELNIAVTGKKNISLVQFTVTDTARKGIVLYFHGNRGNILRYARYASQFTRNGYEAWMIDYPGYGKSTGKRSEKVLYEDAMTVYNLALDQVPVERIIIYGKSLGSGIATQLASVRDCKRVILETPYFSMRKLAAHYFFMYPVMLLNYEIPTYKYLDDVRSPVAILHGTNDRLIPYKHAKWLVRDRPKTELISIKNGRHNNLADFGLFQDKIDSLLRD